MFLGVGLIGPLCVAALWFDLLQTGMDRRLRLAMIGYLGSAIAGLAIIIFIPLAQYFYFP